MFYKVSTNTELVSPEPLLLEEREVRVSNSNPNVASGHNFFNEQPTYNLALCTFCLRASNLIYTVDSLTLNSWPTLLIHA